MYPIMRPANDIPRPLTRPPLRKMRLREVCPITMAAIPNGRNREKKLSIRLATAILLSTGLLGDGLLNAGLLNAGLISDGWIVRALGACGCSAGDVGSIGTASRASGLPQRRQYFRPSAFSCEQCGHIIEFLELVVG